MNLLQLSEFCFKILQNQGNKLPKQIRIIAAKMAYHGCLNKDVSLFFVGLVALVLVTRYHVC